jgi:hypothetical protein
LISQYRRHQHFDERKEDKDGAHQNEGIERANNEDRLLVCTGLEYVQAMLVEIREMRFDVGALLCPTSRPAEWQTISELVIALNRLQSVIMH